MWSPVGEKDYRTDKWLLAAGTFMVEYMPLMTIRERVCVFYRLLRTRRLRRLRAVNWPSV
jgi:hypothetical protein